MKPIAKQKKTKPDTAVEFVDMCTVCGETETPWGCPKCGLMLCDKCLEENGCPRCAENEDEEK